MRSPGSDDELQEDGGFSTSQDPRVAIDADEVGELEFDGEGEGLYVASRGSRRLFVWLMRCWLL